MQRKNRDADLIVMGLRRSDGATHFAVVDGPTGRGARAGCPV